MFRKTKVCHGLMLAFGGSLALGSPFAAAQQQLERVEITGSAIKRIDAETSLPVTVMSRDEITRSGVTNMEQLVQRLSSASSAGNTTGSQTAGLSTYGLSSISLRGLGEQRTLVLVNGRRLAVFAGGGTGGAVDINAIPVAAIDRVEVLRDGASALYGSDAVAGVVNFILRKDFNGLEGSVNVGTPSKSGGGKVNRATLLFGKGDLATDKFNVMVGVDLEKSSALFASERDFSNSGNRPPFFSNAATPTGRIEGLWDPAKWSINPATGQYVSTNGRSASNPYGITTSGFGNPYAPGRCGEINMFPAGAGGVDGAFQNCNFDSAPYTGLFPKVERSSFFGSAKLEVSPALQLYGEALYSKTKSTETYQPSPVRNSFLYPGDLAFTDPAVNTAGVAPALLVHPSNPVYNSILVPYFAANGLTAMQASGLPVAVTLRTFLTGPRTDVATNEQTRLVAGTRGSVGSWDYDIGAAFNQAKTGGGVVNGYFSQLGLASILNNPASNWNPWAPGGVQDPSVSSQLESAKYIGPTISGISRAYSIDGTASTELGKLAGGPIQLAVGSSVRRERYKIEVPASLGSGDIAGLGGAVSPEDDSRTVSAIFSEVNLPVLKTLELNASGRVDKYSDVGSSSNGKLSARWTPVPRLLLRGAVGTGFRAPTLVELHQPHTVGVSEQFVDPQHAGDGLVQANAVIGGNPNLKPEKSRQLSLGIVASPVSNLTGSLDFFLIKIKNYITQPAALALVNGVRNGTPLYGPDDATFAADGTVDTVTQINRNAASALLRGVDVNVNWNDRFAFGKLAVDLSGTYMQTFDLTTLAGVQHSVGTIIQPDGTPLDVAGLGVIARWKHTLSANWAVGSWSTTLAQNFYLGYRDANDLNGDPHYVPSVATYDAQVAFIGVKNLKLALGVRNLFDKKPPLFIGNGSSFQYGYDPQNFDPRGRFLYVTANYKFW
jgi:iron complex outermembrane receptor protein